MSDNKRDIVYSNRFKKDYRKAHKQGKDMDLVDWIIGQLANDIPLQEKYYDHALKGNWKGYRECHVTPDLLLVYEKTDGGELVLVLVRLASHSELNF